MNYIKFEFLHTKLLKLVDNMESKNISFFYPNPHCVNNKNSEKKPHHSNTRYDITQTYIQEFACSLYPERAKYPWVGCSIGADGKGESVSHASELFMAADSKMITIGGGLVQITIDLSDFLFSLHPVRAKYPWVGCQEDSKDEGDVKTSHANSLFMAADNTMITVGGGYV